MDGIKVENLTFTYNEGIDPVFQDIDLEFKKGALTLLLGPSGCGKSTLLLTLNGLIPYSIEGKLDGNIFYNNEEITEKKPKELCTKIGLVHQDPESSIFSFTVEEEVVFGLENLCYPREKMEERLTEVLALVGLSGFEKKEVATLSGGEKQKLAIAAVLALDPEVLILDEPTANLDPVSTLEIFSLLSKLRDQGKTVIVVEHKLEGILDQADEVIILDSNCQVKKQGIPQIDEKDKEIVFARERKNTHPILTLKDVVYHVPEREILNGVDLTINEGDFVALLGANGVGKSTLFKTIAKLIPLTRGEEYFLEKNIESYDFKNLFKSLGLVFQNPEHQFVTFRVWDEMIYGMSKEEKEDKEIIEGIEGILEKFRLLSKKESNPYQLSGGEKRRLSVAIMLAAGQKLLCMDEPTFGQDYESNRELMEDMKTLNEQGTTLFVITHDMNLVAEYCNRAVVLDAGKVVFDGTPKNLFNEKDILRNARLMAPRYRYSFLEEILKGGA